MFKPTEAELAEAKQLGIEGAEKMNGIELRDKIRKAKLRQRERPLTPNERACRTLNFRCKKLGAKLPPPEAQLSLARLRALYDKLMRQALIDVGIVEDAEIEVPRESASAGYGKATVRGVGPLNRMDHDIMVTLKFANESRAKTYHAWHLWVALSGIEIE